MVLIHYITLIVPGLTPVDYEGRHEHSPHLSGEAQGPLPRHNYQSIWEEGCAVGREQHGDKPDL